MTDQRATAYTDGSCLGNPGPGGWAVHIELPDGRVVELGGAESETTNNRMELRAGIEALRVTADCTAVTIITDSQYLRRGVTGWLAGWKRNGWRTSGGHPVENRDLWTELDGLARDSVVWEWTRGHAGTPGNERCDVIARWFAEGIGRLAPSASGHARPMARNGKAPPSGTSYLSLVDGIIVRHPTWAACERRVHGVRGARYRKVRGENEARALVAAWGLPPDALEYAERSEDGP